MAAFTEGMPCWVDAQLPDLEAGKRFYGELFGWTYGEGVGERRARYAEAFLDGKPVAALVAKRDGRMPTTWGIHFFTEDAARAAAAVRDAGGQVITAPVPVGRLGTMALAADPGGAVFGLWQQGELSGFEVQGLPGSFCWTEVYTRQKEAVDRFYAEVFGFQGTPLPDDTIDYLMWSPAGTDPGEDTAIGGRSVITDAFPAEMPGHFLIYFSVADCDETVGTVMRLGGRVTTPPFDIPYGRMAVLADNQGASFAVLAEPAGARRTHGPREAERAHGQGGGGAARGSQEAERAQGPDGGPGEDPK